MRVISYACHNVKRVSDVQFDLDGRHLFLVGGKNRQGKSSAIDGILAALCGRSGMDAYPEVLLKEGENEGWVKIQLSGEQEQTHQPAGMTVELKLIRHPRKGTVVEEFQILDSDGDPAPAPRELLKRLYSMRAFDPLAFQRMDKKSRKALLERLLGLDFTEDNERIKRLFDRRTDVNRDIKAEKARLDGMPLHPACEEASATELMTELERRQEINKANFEEKKKLSALEHEHTAAVSAEKAAIESIEQLKAQMSAAEKRLEAARAKISEIRTSASLQQERIAALVDANVDEVRIKIKNIDTNNEMARANVKRKECFDKWQDLSKQADALTEKMDSIKKANETKLAEAKFPVPGMSLDSEGILLNGLPFEQASTEERINASVDVGIALNPLLRLMVSQDGGALDDAAIKALDAKLVDNDFQMIVEVATRSASDEDLCAVIVADGKVSKTNPVKANLFEESAA